MTEIEESYQEFNELRNEIIELLRLKFKGTSVNENNEFQFKYFDDKYLVRSYINPVESVGFINTYRIKGSPTELNRTTITQIPEMELRMILDYTDGLICYFPETQRSYKIGKTKNFTDDYDELFIEWFDKY